VQANRTLIRHQSAFEHDRRWLHLAQFFWGYHNPFRWFHGHGFAVRAEFLVFAHTHNYAPGLSRGPQAAASSNLIERGITTPRGGEFSAVQVQRVMTAARW
jgi:hypothetical protein